ncbi:hypothetical protein FRB96_004240 [Tulasnella sp. 330]|nr:hypothetical protein FRB96_004240 [Tulasnella sp. 330]KAG8880678.1 hypothetical protein FRB98_004954 [Tulasnella sp. 332]
MSSQKGSSRAPPTYRPQEDSIRKAAYEIERLIQRARAEESSQSQVLIQRAQWEADQLRAEGSRVKEELSKEIEALKRQLAVTKGVAKSSSQRQD